MKNAVLKMLFQNYENRPNNEAPTYPVFTTYYGVGFVGGGGGGGEEA